MASLSAGQVSALIAAGTAALQVLLPLAIPLILVALISKQNRHVQETAITWSVLSRKLHSTYWPTILGSDSSASSGVNPVVVCAVYMGIITTILVAVTAVITPLGLYDAVAPSKSQRISFSYAQDMAPFGYGSLPRTIMDFNRICGGGEITCPGSNFSVIRTDNPNNLSYEVEWPNGYYTNISLETQNLWASGLDAMGGSVSGMFDIRWRFNEIRQQNLSGLRDRYNATLPTNLYDNGSTYAVGSYRQVHSLLPNNEFEIVEGLIVDLASGGIGFRNHTIPSQARQRATWAEDILFIVPETKCVDANLSIDYDLKEDAQLHTIEPSGVFRLTDRGGFANLNSTVNLEGMRMNSSQDNVRLQDRALVAAWYSNAYTMLYMNLTNFERAKAWEGYEKLSVGQSYLLEDKSNQSYGSLVAGSMPKAGTIAIGRLGQHLDLPFRSAPINGNSSKSQIFANPHKITKDDFSELDWVVKGRVDDFSLAHISNIAMSAGMLYPPPRPIGRESTAFDRGKPGDVWSQPMYSCVSACRATIKTVTFLYNGTGSLSDLHVIDATEKLYSNTSSMPVWGVEDSGLTYRNIKPFWGLLSPEMKGKPNVSTLRKESLWLPGATPLLTSFSPVDSAMNIPGASFYATVMGYIYEKLLADRVDYRNMEVHPYSGHAQFALSRRWLELGQNATRSAEIINLIWTDMAANAVVGTRGWMTTRDGSMPSPPEVTFFERRTRYHIIYAVPAMLLLLLALIIGLTTAVLLILRRTGLGRMNWFLDQTSLGRNLTVLLYSDVTSQEATRKSWAKRDGQRLVTMDLQRPHAGMQAGVEVASYVKDDTVVSHRLIRESNAERLEE